jgi:predicted phage tail protein
VWSLQSAAGTLTGRLSMAAFILGWAGVSVHCQVLSFIGGSGLSTKPYLIGKLLHGVISAALVAVVSRFVPFTTTASGYYAEQITAIAGADFMTSLRTSMLIAGVLFLLLAAASLQKKRWLEKREQV